MMISCNEEEYEECITPDFCESHGFCIHDLDIFGGDEEWVRSYPHSVKYVIFVIERF